MSTLCITTVPKQSQSISKMVGNILATYFWYDDRLYDAQIESFMDITYVDLILRCYMICHTNRYFDINKTMLLLLSVSFFQQEKKFIAIVATMIFRYSWNKVWFFLIYSLSKKLNDVNTMYTKANLTYTDLYTYHNLISHKISIPLNILVG